MAVAANTSTHMKRITLQDLGYDPSLDDFRKTQNLETFDLGRVVSEHKERYAVRTTDREYDAEIIGHLRYSAQQRADFPAVGDWVAVSEYDEGKALIHAVFPRKTVLERQTVGKAGETQIIAANIDWAWIVQAADRDFNTNRIERYLTICHAAAVKPVVLLNKIDLADPAVLAQQLAQLKERLVDVPVRTISNETGAGIAELKDSMLKGETYCLLGSSGVGKSTLLNNLSGVQWMQTDAISASTQKGRHVTSHRELVVLDNGAILIDNPGMREVGIADPGSGLETTFDRILERAKDCRFKDCSHTTEEGCAVLQAVENGEIAPGAYENYLKMEREKAHFEMTVAERRKKEKDFGKLIKHYKKVKKANGHPDID
jgi:ribosome biogenesis GTPase